MILPDVPGPFHFFSGVCRTINEMMAPHELFNGNDCVIERGWVWLPKKLEPPVSSRLIRLAITVIKSAGGKFSTTRGRYYHVGTSWAPCERLLNDCGVSRERNGEWSDPKSYDIEFQAMMTYIDELAVEQGVSPNPFVVARAIMNMSNTGWLLNDTPRRKRVMKEDPMIAILREGGLLA